MSFTLLRKFAVLGVVLFVVPACSKGNPTQPTVNRLDQIPAAAPVTVTLSNLSGRYVGVSDELCGTAASKVPIDDLTLNYQVSGASLAGALLVACESAACDNRVPLGALVECPVPPDPCASGISDAIAQGTAPACFTGDPTDSGTIQVLAKHQANLASWIVMALFTDTGDHSNSVSATVDEPQAPVVSDGSTSSVRIVRRIRR